MTKGNSNYGFPRSGPDHLTRRQSQTLNYYTARVAGSPHKGWGYVVQDTFGNIVERETGIATKRAAQDRASKARKAWKAKNEKTNLD